MLVRMCRESELPEGGVKSFRIMAKTVAVFKLNGELYGLETDCKHMKASVAGGKIEGTTITCPAHGWHYDITTGQCLNEPWAMLKTYPVTIRDGSICLEIG